MTKLSEILFLEFITLRSVVQFRFSVPRNALRVNFNFSAFFTNCFKP